MWTGLAIGGGLALLGLLVIFVVGHLFDMRLVKNYESANDERKQIAAAYQAAVDKAAVLEGNDGKLREEISSLKTQNEMLTRQLAAVQKETDDLLAAIQTHQPSALPDALRAQLAQLRRKVIDALPTTPSAGSADRPEDRAVHGGPVGNGNPR